MSVFDIINRLGENAEPFIKTRTEQLAHEQPKLIRRTISAKTGVPVRYREEWEHPANEEWQDQFGQAYALIVENGIVALVGNRGTGKTRLAAELIRKTDRRRSRYLVAMDLFLRLRATFGQNTPETEREVVSGLSSAPLLVLDEVQERGESDWEDRVLTHIFDKRYGMMKPTVLIANLMPDALAKNLGHSICDRMREEGGIIQMTGDSHRSAQRKRGKG